MVTFEMTGPVIVTDTFPVVLASFEAATANVNVPMRVGVPDRRPDVERLSPDGRLPDATEYVPPAAAVNWYPVELYAEPTTPATGVLAVHAADG
jgi:hypothetical protein